MAKSQFSSVDEYIASKPEAVQSVLKRVRDAIRRAIPKADEVISYNMPTYRLHDETVLHFAAWKQHYSLYPANARVVAAFKDEIAPYKVEKSTLQFPYAEPVPVRLIERVAKFREREVTGREP